MTEGQTAHHTRAQLEQLVRSLDETIDGLGDWHDATEHLEWARKKVCAVLVNCDPPVLEYTAELAALPVGAVVLTEQGGIFEWDGDFWMETGDDVPHRHEDLSLPATVLHVPPDGARD